MNKRNNKLKPWVKLTLNIILIVFLATIICYVSFVIHINMKKDKKTFAINYNNEPRLDYQVCIKENPYYLSKCLNKGKTYPSSIIETINYNISDNFRTSKIIDMIYTYEVTANLVSETDSRNLMTEELWNKKYVLVQKTTKKIKANHIELNEAFNIDYRYYENIIENYKKDFPVSMKGYLKINYKVNIKSPDEKINKKIVLTSKISLLEPMVKITDKIPGNINKNIYINKSNIFKYTLYIVLNVILFMFAIILVIKSCKIKLKSEYRIMIDKYLQLYKDIIIVVKVLPSCEKLEIVDIKEFADLVDLEQELKIPIMYYEENEIISIFAIFSDKYMYRIIYQEKNRK